MSDTKRAVDHADESFTELEARVRVTERRQKRAMRIVGLAFVALALMGIARPVSDLALFLKLNGQPTTWVMGDGGRSGMFGSAQQCMPVSPGDVVKVTPSAAMFLCSPSPSGAALVAAQSPGVWDGGCSATATDMNAGDYIGANVEHYIIVNDSTVLCQVPVTGSVSTPAFRMQ